jgi:hypothetical protein
MILKKSGSEDDSFVLINEKVIPDLDALKYLQKQEAKKEISYAIISNLRMIISNGLITGPNFSKGDKVESYDGTIVSGTYRTTSESQEMYVVVENGVIQSTYYLVNYIVDEQNIIFKQKNSIIPVKGDTVINKSNLQIDISKKFKLIDKYQTEYTVKVNSDGEIISLNDQQFFNVILAIVFIVIAFIAILLAFPR